jgi:hypothetical protein
MKTKGPASPIRADADSWLARIADAVERLGTGLVVQHEADGVTLEAPLRIRVRSRPYAVEFGVDAHDGPQVPISIEADDEDDAFASAMDLVVAGLRGTVALRETSRRGRVVRRAVELSGASSRPTVIGRSVDRGVGWGRTQERVLRNQIEGLPDASDVVRPPWAPWLGLGGFTTALASAPAASVPIDGVLDLHQHRPKDVGRLVGAYLDECRAHGRLQVRIIHGKGKGVLRRTVHSILERREDVTRFRLGGSGGGGWGATIVDLQDPEPEA